MPETAELIRDLEPRLVDARQAGKLLGLCRTSVFSLVAAGELHRVRIGRVVRFQVSEIDALVRRGAEGARIRFGYGDHAEPGADEA